ACLEGPNQHYLTPGPPSQKTPVGYNWGVRDHWLTSVALHHDMVRETAAILRQSFNVSHRLFLLGFSQPVGLNYRLVATHPAEFTGVFGICGGLPRDWEEAAYQVVSTAILHISRSEDEYYPVDIVTRFPDRLRLRAADVEFHLLPGAHRFPSRADMIVRPWL